MGVLIDNLASVGKPTRTRVTSSRRLLSILQRMEMGTHLAMVKWASAQKNRGGIGDIVNMETGNTPEREDFREVGDDTTFHDDETPKEANGN